MIASMLPYRWTAILVIVLGLLAAIGFERLQLADARLEVSHLQEAKALEDKQRADLRAKQVADTAATQAAIVDAAAEQGKNDAEKLAAIAADRDRVLRLLRNHSRVAGPAAVPSSATTAGGGSAGADGAGSATPDVPASPVDFLVGEAARADQQSVALESCLRQYEGARRLINGADKK